MLPFPVGYFQAEKRSRRFDWPFWACLSAMLTPFAFEALRAWW